MKEKETILIVDDEPTNLSTYSKIFKDAGYRVKTAKNSDETFSIFDQKTPDLVLLDIVLDDESGLDVLKNIKKDPAYKDTFVVMISAKLKSSDEQATGLEYGADGYVTRPIERRELIARVEAFLRHGRTLNNLRKSENRFRKIFERNPDAMIIVDIDGNIKFANPSAENLFKVTLDDLCSRSFGYPIIKGEHTEIDIVRRHEDRAVAEMRSIDIEWDDRPTFLTSIRDITARKKAEDEVRESEENLRITLGSIGDAVITTGIYGRVQRMNAVAENLTGWANKEAVGRPLHEVMQIYNAKTRKPVDTPVDKIIRTGKKVGLANQTLLISKDGSEYLIADSGAPILNDSQNITGVVLVFRDVTKEYKLQEELITREKRFRSLFEQSGDGVIIADLQGNIVDVNQTCCELFGYSKKQLCRMHVSQTHPPDSLAAERGAKAFQKIKEKGEVKFEEEFITSDGRIIIGEVTANIVEVFNDKLIHAIVRDVTQRIQSEKELQESQRRITTLLGNLPGMAYRCHNTKNWTMEFVSEGCQNITGYKPEELIHNHTIAYGELISDDDYDRVWQEVQNAIKKDKKFELEYRIRTKTNEERWVWERGVAVSGDEHVEMLEGFISDITGHKQADAERERLQTQLNQAQKIESVGRLAGGVAHDFNNMLSVILGYSELMLAKLDPNDPAYHPLQEIQKAGTRSSSLTQQLLAFARKQTIAPKVIDLNDTVSD
ncbi:MAG: PAS domain S-box protein, partial [Caldithrix sp.]|nr:PAS domain S-box protein [Caldithrix sp.]